MARFLNPFRSRDKPKNRLPGGNWSIHMGLSTSGSVVTERSAMQMTAVYACVRILAEAVAGLPLHLYRYTENGGKEKDYNNRLYHLLHDEPNPEMSSFTFRETMMTHLLLWGNAYAQKIVNGKGELIALYPLMSSRMTVDRDETGRIVYKYDRYGDEHDKENRTVVLDSSEIFHVPGLGFDGLVGYSPVAMAKNAIGMAIACEEYGASLYKNGARPSGVLTSPNRISDVGRENLKQSWAENYSGSRNAGRVPILEEGLRYEPISINPQEAQFLETRKFQMNEIARIYRVPPHMVGDLEKASYSSIEQQSMEFVRYTLDPWLCRWEQAMQRSLFTDEEKKNHFFRFNVGGLLRGDYQSRMQGYAIARQNGWMNADEIRELEDMDKLPDGLGGNLYLINGNMMEVKDAGAAYKSD